MFSVIAVIALIYFSFHVAVYAKSKGYHDVIAVVIFIVGLIASPLVSVIIVALMPIIEDE